LEVCTRSKQSAFDHETQLFNTLDMIAWGTSGEGMS